MLSSSLISLMTINLVLQEAAIEATGDDSCHNGRTNLIRVIKRDTLIETGKRQIESALLLQP